MGTVGEGALSEMQSMFQSVRLLAPPFPERFRTRFECFAKWSYGTRMLEPLRAYRFMPCATDALSRDVADYLVVSHEGHGANSYSINYVLVDGPLAIVVQSLFGGAYTDAKTARVEINLRMAAIEDLLALFEPLREGLSRKNVRLVVLDSAFRGISAAGWASPDAELSTWVEDQRVEAPFEVAKSLLGP